MSYAPEDLWRLRSGVSLHLSFHTCSKHVENEQIPHILVGASTQTKVSGIPSVGLFVSEARMDLLDHFISPAGRAFFVIVYMSLFFFTFGYPSPCMSVINTPTHCYTHCSRGHAVNLEFIGFQPIYKMQTFPYTYRAPPDRTPRVVSSFSRVNFV